MSHILTQEEVDALLRGISGGEIETEIEQTFDPSDVVNYDLTSQDRIIRGRMPTLEMTNEKFARMFRATLSSMLRKVVSVSALSVDMIKFGEFLKTLPVPTSLHLFRMDPLRGSALIVRIPRYLHPHRHSLPGAWGRTLQDQAGIQRHQTSVSGKSFLSGLNGTGKGVEAPHRLTISYQGLK
jgi:flagellar motor switch protein FliM